MWLQSHCCTPQRDQRLFVWRQRERLCSERYESPSSPSRRWQRPVHVPSRGHCEGRKAITTWLEQTPSSRKSQVIYVFGLVHLTAKDFEVVHLKIEQGVCSRSRRKVHMLNITHSSLQKILWRVIAQKTLWEKECFRTRRLSHCNSFTTLKLMAAFH